MKKMHKKNTVKNNSSKYISKRIVVKNAEGEPDTQAEILVQNKIDYEPKVSVIIPVYNVEDYLRECLDSVCGQTLKEIEIICVDDGSTDSSLEILKEYAAKDCRMTVMKQKNLHAGVARNAGLSVAKGEYLSFLDSDDFFELNMLKETYEVTKKEKSDITFYQYKNYNNETKQAEKIAGINKQFQTNEKGYTVLQTADIAPQLFTICNPMPWNKLINHHLVKQEQLYFQSLTASNDVYFSQMILACSQKVVLWYKTFAYYRYNRNASLKNNRDKYPLNFYYAYSGLRNTLKNKNLYEKYYITFLTSYISSALWTVEHTNKARQQVKDYIKEKIIPEFSILTENKNIFSEYMINRIKRIYEPDIIISLTSYPARINTVNQTIESLLNQSMKADRVILWLAPEQFPNKEADLPQQLLALKDKGLTIDWYHDIKSYKKLIPTLKKYPDAVIVTADDDNIYQYQWLEKLYNSYIEYPKDIHCHRVTKFVYGSTGFSTVAGGYDYYKGGSYLNKLVGLGGVLYPPYCFYKDILDEKLIMQLAPTNDDQWFWFQAILNDTKIRVVDDPLIKATYIPGTQEFGLTNINDKGKKLFWKDFRGLIGYYPSAKKMLIRESKKHKNNYKFAVPFKADLENWWYRINKYPLNLDNPRTFNEKIQWLKLYDSTPIKTRLADKYLVRDWVKEKIGEEYLIPLLGVYDKFEEIDFDKLPNQFVIKCNHGSGWNIIVKDKSKLDLDDVKEKLDKWMNENFAFKYGCELHYRDIQPKIIIEKYMENKGSQNLYDYKFWCFNGEVKYMQFRDDFSANLKMVFYDLNWNKQTFYYDHPLYDKELKKPSNFEQMIEIAKKLCKEFAFVCVDLYRLNDGTIYFGEMTFTRSSGCAHWSDKKINLKLGKMIQLPKRAYNIDTGEYYKLPKMNAFKPYLFFPYYLLKLTSLKQKLKKAVVKKIVKNLITMRVDIKNIGIEQNAVNIIAEKAKVMQPTWFSNTQGAGKVVESSEIKQKININAIKSGNLKIDFRGVDKRYNNKSFPVYIDYKSIKIDGKEILSSPTTTWHDKPFNYQMPVKDGQKIILEIEQQYHQYSKEELQNIIFKLNSQSNYVCSHLKKFAWNVYRKANNQKKGICYFLFHKKKTDRYIKTYICGICVKKKKTDIRKYLDMRLAQFVQTQTEQIQALSKQEQTLQSALKNLQAKQCVHIQSNIENLEKNITNLLNTQLEICKDDNGKAHLAVQNVLHETIQGITTLIQNQEQLSNRINTLEEEQGNKIQNLSSWIGQENIAIKDILSKQNDAYVDNIMVLSEQTKVANDHLSEEIKNNINSVLKAVEREQVLYSNPFEVKTRQERGFCDITETPDFENRFRKLISNLPIESVETLINIINKLKWIKNSNTKLDLFNVEEKQLLKKVDAYYKSILKISNNLYCYKNYLLPINHFEPSVFFYRHGLDTLKHPERFENKAILDIGAFIGDSALILSPLTQNKVYSFEAITENYNHLLKTVELNNLKNIVPVKAAVGSENSTIELRFAGSGSSSSSVMVKEPEYIEKCQVIKIDDYVKEHNLDVGLIKVDIEGAEQEFLKGAMQTIKQQKPTLLISIYHNIDDFLDIKPLIESWNLGYSFSIYKPIINNISGETLLICE